MGDRTNITDARQHDAEQAAGVIEQAMRNEGLIDKDVRLMGEIIAEALDAAGYDVVLRADPDTSDELASEARRLLDRWDALDLSDIVDDARPLIAALLERAVTAEADRDEAERRERTAVNLANYHRDVARTAGGRAQRAEAEARQLREVIGDPKKLRLTAMSVRSVSRSASLHLHRIADAAAVAEGAEDRGQTDG